MVTAVLIFKVTLADGGQGGGNKTYTLARRNAGRINPLEPGAARCGTRIYIGFSLSLLLLSRRGVKGRRAGESC